MPVSSEGTYEIIDGRGIRHELTIQYRERLAMFLYFLDGRKISVNDRYGYIYADTGKAVGKSLVAEIDRHIFGKAVPLGVDIEEE